LKGKGQELELNGRVLDFYDLYSKNLDKYLVTIFERPYRKGLSEKKRKCISRVYGKDCIKRACTRNQSWNRNGSPQRQLVTNAAYRDQTGAAGSSKHIQVVLPNNIPQMDKDTRNLNPSSAGGSGGFLVPLNRPIHTSHSHRPKPQPGPSTATSTVPESFSKYVNIVLINLLILFAH